MFQLSKILIIWTLYAKKIKKDINVYIDDHKLNILICLIFF